MKLVQFEDVPLKEVSHSREGRLAYRCLVEGTPGTPGNFSFMMTQTFPDYATPRHRHNFEQFKWRLQGEQDYERDGVLHTGTAVYIPEGNYYGPTSENTDAGGSNLVFQFGGPSGNGYMSQGEYQASTAQLKKTGTFHNGIYTRTSPEGKKQNQDGYEAAWENWRKRRLLYPELRYPKPEFFYPAELAWSASGREPGVSYKRFGNFPERNARFGYVRVEPGATMRLEARSIYFVVSGEGDTVEGGFIPYSTLYLEEEDIATITAGSRSELIHMVLPDLSGVKQRSLNDAAAPPKLAAADTA
ncbi:MAG: hypothetical protein EXR27_09770 [Betaproteobacteria bacterium]|nr:hypothetical protein [Betaproteobacteria bacterium]